MVSMFSLFFSGSMLALSSAMPYDATKAVLAVRQDGTTYNASGNVKMTFSDYTIPIGTAPAGEIFGNFLNTCSTSGLCATTDVTVTGYNLWAAGLNPSSDTGIDLTITPGGSFQTPLHNGLLDAMNAAFTSVVTCADVTHYTHSDVDPHGFTTMTTVSECTIPAFVGLTLQDPGSTDAPSFLEFTVAISASDSGASGFCSTFSTIVGTVGGAIDPVAGGIFSLLGLFCGTSA